MKDGQIKVVKWLSAKSSATLKILTLKKYEDTCHICLDHPIQTVVHKHVHKNTQCHKHAPLKHFCYIILMVMLHFLCALV